MAGYNWRKGKSHNAVRAETDGLMVATAAAKWARQELGIKCCTARDIAHTIPSEEWHHTSKFYNRVDYYRPETIEDLRDKLLAHISRRKQNAKPGLGAEIQMLLTSFGDCGLPGEDWYIAVLKNNELAAVQRKDGAADGNVVVRALTPAEHAAAKTAWPVPALDRTLAQ